ncbi:MAG: lipopolysaccharide biosynthesis protein [Mediterranea sp.]|jgi:O-antigen/teichoic acid export membrane protein|nr:lipopolysaccharide biosynthesis protein [Mediterranea sp.]
MTEQTLKQKTAKGLFWGGISNGAQQLLMAFFGLFLLRLLDPADYGMVGKIAIFSALAGVLQESGFTAALVNKKEVTDRDYNAVFWSNIGLSLFLYLLLFACAPLIARFYESPELTALCRYIFLGFLVSSLGIAQNAHMFRNLMVKEKAISLMAGLVVSGTVGVAMAFGGYSYWALATQTILNVLVVNLCYWHFSSWRPTFTFDLSPLRGMIGFSSKLLFTNIFSRINSNYLSVIIGKLYTNEEVGYFTQADKWNYMGYSLVNGMIAGVAQPVLASISDDRERQRRTFRKMLRFTAFISFPAMLGLSFIAPEFVTVVLTDKWADSTVILQLLCIAGAFIPLNTLYSNLLISKGRSDTYMWVTIAQGVLQMATVLACYPYGIITMITAYAAINAGWLLVWHYFVWREIGLRLLSLLKDILPFALAILGAMAVAWFLTRDIANIYLLFIAKVAVSAALYLLVMWLSRAVTFHESMTYLRSAFKKEKRKGSSQRHP